MPHIIAKDVTHLEREDQELLNSIGDKLIQAYFAELETAMNYISLINNLRGVEAEIIKDILREEVKEEFDHAQKLADRIRVLGYRLPASSGFRDSDISIGQRMLQEAQTVTSCCKAVIKAESEAMDLYKEIIDLAADRDPVTADLVTELLADEENHFRTFNNMI